MTDENIAANLEALAALAGAIQRTDRKALARQLVMEKAILDVLKDANAETRERGRQEFDSSDADSAKLGDAVIGRVRRDKPTGKWSVQDWPLFEAWVRANVPHAWIAIPRVDPGFIAAVCKTGAYIDRETGELLPVDGIGYTESDGNLVVTTTDAAEDLARELITEQLKVIES
jgi:hypothetical protein